MQAVAWSALACDHGGALERWDLVNASPMDHPFHLHGTQFQVQGREPRGRTP